MKIVKITWRDAMVRLGDQTAEELADTVTPIYQTLGFRLEDSKEGDVVLAGERNSLGQFRQVTLIPGGMVIDTEILSG